MVKKIALLILGCAALNTAYANHTIDDRELECMVRVSLAEGENQTRIAKVGIMYTVHNRVKSKLFKTHSKSHCGMINNKKNQFSHRKVKIPKKQHDLFMLAKSVLLETIEDPTKGALFFHDGSLKRNPFRHTARTVQLDDMHFYRSTLRSSA
jgi:hypothetical protein